MFFFFTRRSEKAKRQQRRLVDILSHRMKQKKSQIVGKQIRFALTGLMVSLIQKKRDAISKQS